MLESHNIQFEYNLSVQFKLIGQIKPKLPMSIHTNSIVDFFEFLDLSPTEMSIRLYEINPTYCVEMRIDYNTRTYEYRSNDFPHTTLLTEYLAHIETIKLKTLPTMDLEEYLAMSSNYQFSPKSTPPSSPKNYYYDTLKQRTTALFALMGLWEAASPSSQAASEARRICSPISPLSLEFPTDL